MHKCIQNGILCLNQQNTKYILLRSFSSAFDESLLNKDDRVFVEEPILTDITCNQHVFELSVWRII